MNNTQNKTMDRYAGRRELRSSGMLIVGVLVVLLPSCDDLADFGDMNKDPTQVSSVPPSLQMTEIQLQLAGNRENFGRAGYGHAGNVSQYTAGFIDGYNFYVREQDENQWFMNQAYTTYLQGIEALMETLRTMLAEGTEVDGFPGSTAVNLMAATRIMRVYAYHQITDMYGDIPYFEAGRGFIDELFFPKYDPQQEIYTDMLAELASAVDQFDPSQPTYGTADLLFGGDIDEWRRFGNSLRLRLAMRLTKVDEATARTEAEAAIAATGGVMTSNANNAFIQKLAQEGTHCCDLHANAHWYIAAEQVVHLAQTFIDWLKDRNDPRLPVFAGLYGGGTINATADPEFASNDPADLIGLPNGWRITELGQEGHPSYAAAQAVHAAHGFDGDVDHRSFARLHHVMRQLGGPILFVTYAQTALLRAEVAERGWNAGGGSAAGYYAEGVRAALENLAMYGEEAVISNAQIDAYLAANPYVGASGLQQINEQYWVACFLDFIEGWANVRRSGWPALEAAKVDSNEAPTGSLIPPGVMPRRLVYIISEQSSNGENLNAALSRQSINSFSGVSAMTTPVWWDGGN